MKSLLLPFVAILAFLMICPQHYAIASQAASSAGAQSPIAIALSTTSDHYKVDSSIPVVIAISNTGKVPVNLNISIGDEGAYRSLGLRFALTIGGQEVEKTAFHRAIRGEPRRGEPGVRLAGRSDVYTMTPERVDHLKIDIKKLFNITQPGMYLFSVVMPVNMDNKTEIYSQPLAIDVVP
jgi:hypothetical protein